MSETPVRIPSGSIDLEAFYEKGKGGAAALVCHPHPLYGGSMENNVVLVLQEALAHWGWGTLRFNFRGVGQSLGHYEDGEGEVGDALAAAVFLRNRGHDVIHAAGYSYGAWIVLKALAGGLDPASLLLVSPPLDFLDFTGLALPVKPCLITLGDKDDFCRVASLRHWMEEESAASGSTDFAVFSGCDHFYRGAEDELSHRINAFLKERFPWNASEKNREPEH